MSELFDFLRSVGFWIFLIIFFGGGSALYAPVKKLMDQRHERKMKELEIREKEAEIGLQAAKQAELEHWKTADMPVTLDPKDPVDVEEWEAAKRETSQLAARAATTRQKI